MFRGRSSRKEYWLSVATISALIALTFVLPIPPDSALDNSIGTGLSVSWLFVWIRRLHDLGKSGWFVLLPLGVSILILGFGFAIGGPTFADLLRGEGPQSGDMNDAFLAGAVLVLVLAIHVGFTVWLGLAQGERQANRFGAAPM